MSRFDALPGTLALRLLADVPAELQTEWHAAETDGQRATVLLDMAYFFEATSKWQAIELAQDALIHAERAGSRAASRSLRTLPVRRRGTATLRDRRWRSRCAPHRRGSKSRRGPL